MPLPTLANSANTSNTSTSRPRWSIRLSAISAVIVLIAVATAFTFDQTGAQTAAQAVLPAIAQSDEPTDADEPEGPALDELSLRTVGQFIAPVEVFSRPGDDRSFVVELIGTINVADPTPTEGGPAERKTADEEEPEPILDITELTAIEGERGLLGAAFHPFESLLYVHYSDLDGDTVIAEYEIDPDTAIADPETARVVLTADQPYDNHNGGEIAFGRDGFLYIGLGDGGLANDPHRAALDLASPLGKILRIDPRETEDAAYSVPRDNPFADTNSDEVDPTIWSYGLRNPWKFSFDAATGDLWIADVGQDKWEEINRAEANDNKLHAGRGVSFGWSAYEGTERFNDDQRDYGHTDPFVTYERDEGRCSISGGAVYRGDAIPALDGWYVYGDYCTGQVFAFDTTADDDDREILELARSEALVSVSVGGDGELYIVSVGGAVSLLG